MKIVFVSKLRADKGTGPAWSVPARIKAQTAYDDVFWINLSQNELAHWKEIEVYHNIKDFGKLSLDKFPKEFSNPDLVVFEEFYFFEMYKFSKVLLKKGIPYIIVPRCSLTCKAQHIKWFKKKIANYLFFNKYAQKALCIQYLTEAEKIDSTDKWNSESIILPNGFTIPLSQKENFSTLGTKAIYIGRLNIFQKGLDLLLSSINAMKIELRKDKFSLHLYGPLNRDYEILKGLIEEYDISDIVIFGGEITGKAKEDIILSSDLFIMTSRFEGLPMALLEVLAYGLPVVVTPGTNMQKEIIRRNAGWDCEGNIDSICSTLRRVSLEKVQFKEKGKNARELSTEYDWKEIALKFHHEIVKRISK